MDAKKIMRFNKALFTVGAPYSLIQDRKPDVICGLLKSISDDTLEFTMVDGRTQVITLEEYGHKWIVAPQFPNGTVSYRDAVKVSVDLSTLFNENDEYCIIVKWSDSTDVYHHSKYWDGFHDLVSFHIGDSNESITVSTAEVISGSTKIFKESDEIFNKAFTIPEENK